VNYQETIEYLFHKLPMFSRLGSAAIKKDLTNTRLLCEHLGNPQHYFRSIHVAGTNGKGSVSHMLASILQTAGYKTGLYTSPHLYDFRERIRLNGMMVEEDYVIDFVARIKPLIETIEPSFFEITVAMAFDFFAHSKVDIAIIEVGLGGRLDSTNIITPELSVITNIGWDHMNMLGNTLEAIAAEKAGIIKPGIPVVVGETVPETHPVFQRISQEKAAPLYLAYDRFQTIGHQEENDFLKLEIRDADKSSTSTYYSQLKGIYQTRNVCTVLQAIKSLPGFNISDATIQEGIRTVVTRTGLQGRWEVIHRKPDVVLEVAHNEDGIRQMVTHLKDMKYEHLHIIIGTVKDREIEKILALLPADASYYFTEAHIPRALQAVTLQEKARAFQLKGSVYNHVNDALQQALIESGLNDLILVCGSIFLVAEVNKSLQLNVS
jgi:dihydrofolate synthase/folylpolyglutamate synthase